MFTSAINTSKWKPPWKAAAKIKNFEKKPANGGIPASENRASVIRNASLGLVLYSPLYSSSVKRWARKAIIVITANTERLANI